MVPPVDTGTTDLLAVPAVSARRGAGFRPVPKRSRKRKRPKKDTCTFLLVPRFPCPPRLPYSRPIMSHQGST